MAIPVTAALAAFSGLLMVLLGFRVSTLRFRLKIPFGDGGNPALMRAVRAHGNTAEHTPIVLLLALAWELSRGGGPFLTGMAVLFVVSRLLFATGVLGRGLHWLRVAGATGTYAVQVSLAAGLALAALRMA